MANFCDVSFSWEINESPSTVLSFTFKEPGDEQDQEEVGASGYNEEILNESKTPISISQTNMDDGSANCEMRIICKRPASGKINGLSIVSESRTLEISNDSEGYLKSVRGVILPRNSDAEDSSPKLFVCKCSLSDVYTNLTVKFLSLGQRTIFSLHRIVINISQAASKPPPAGGFFDMDKLLKNLAGLGDGVSERAQSMLTTLQQYQKNRQDALNMVGEYNQSIGGGPLDETASTKSSSVSSIDLTRNPLFSDVMTTAPGDCPSNESVLAFYALTAQNRLLERARSKAEKSKPETEESKPGDNDEGPREIPFFTPKERNYDHLSEDVKESLDKMSKTIEENTRSTQAALESFRQEMISKLNAQKAEFDRQYELVEARLEYALTQLEARARMFGQDLSYENGENSEITNDDS